MNVAYPTWFSKYTLKLFSKWIYHLDLFQYE